MNISKDRILRIGEWSFEKRWRAFLIPIVLFLLICDYHKWTFGFLNWQIALPLIIFGQSIRLWSVGVRDSNLNLNILVTAGPYAYVRNPSYLGSFLVGSGIVVMSGLLWFLPIYLILFFAGYQPMVLWEERRLKDMHGDTYVDYKQRVRRWIPSTKRYPQKSAHVLLLARAFRRERDMMAATLALGLLMAIKHLGITDLLQYLMGR